jgi:hypothetical protein
VREREARSLFLVAPPTTTSPPTDARARGNARRRPRSCGCVYFAPPSARATAHLVALLARLLVGLGARVLALAKHSLFARADTHEREETGGGDLRRACSLCCALRATGSIEWWRLRMCVVECDCEESEERERAPFGPKVLASTKRGEKSRSQVRAASSCLPSLSSVFGISTPYSTLSHPLLLHRPTGLIPFLFVLEPRRAESKLLPPLSPPLSPDTGAAIIAPLSLSLFVRPS